MGSSYRNKIDRAAKSKETSIKLRRKQKTRTKKKMTRPKESNKDNDNNNPLMDLMKRYKDEEFKIQDAENSISKLHKERLEVGVEVAVNKSKFQNLTENVKGLREKTFKCEKIA